jgi:NAD/NADP transhydrogenase beta subunit
MTPAHVSLVLLVICIVAAWQVGVIPVSAIQMAVGPVLVPAGIVGLLSLAAVFYAHGAWRGRQPDESQAPGQTALAGSQWRMASLLSGGLVFVVLVSFAGFVLPATLCGMLIARAFDAPLNLKSVLICGSVSSSFWILFSKVLGIGIGPATPFGF